MAMHSWYPYETWWLSVAIAIYYQRVKVAAQATFQSRTARTGYSGMSPPQDANTTLETPKVKPALLSVREWCQSEKSSSGIPLRWKHTGDESFDAAKSGYSLEQLALRHYSEGPCRQVASLKSLIIKTIPKHIDTESWRYCEWLRNHQLIDSFSHFL